MARFVLRGWNLRNILILVCVFAAAVFVQAPVVLAQHGGVHAGGGVPHISPPPAAHPPVAHAPIAQAPVAHAPISQSPSGSPRFSPTPPLTGFGMGNFRYRGRPIRPLPPVFPVFGYYPFYFWRPYYGFGPRWGWGFNSCWSWAYCDLFSNWGLGYNVLPFYAYIPPPPTYAYPLYGYGDERRDLPQLYLKDGTVVTVTDYWLVDGQIHFTVIEEGTTRPVEHIVPLDELDLQRTTDMATQRGFRFVLRNQPLEHYLRSHPDGELEHPRDDQN